jgi:hypothetical protein
MGRLKNSCAYLCGAMEACKDGGIPWRVSVSERLKTLGVRILNPAKIGHETFDIRGDMYKMIKGGDYHEVRKRGKVIRGKDLRMVDDAGFLIFYLDLDVLTCGSWEEVFVANKSKKPVLTVVKQGKEKAPLWLLWAIEPTHIFDNFEQLFDYLTYIDIAKRIKNPGRRWVFYEYETA